MIGMGLIFFLLYLWMQYTTPAKDATEQQTAPTTTQSAEPAAQQSPQAPTPTATTSVPDSLKNALAMAQFGPFAAAASGTEQLEVLENDLVRVTFSSKGGRIKEVFLKKYERINTDSTGADQRAPLRLLEDEKNRMDFELPLNNVAGGKVNTGDLYFVATKNGNSISFRADAGNGNYFEQTYTLSPDNYKLNYQIGGNGLRNIQMQNVY